MASRKYILCKSTQLTTADASSVGHPPGVDSSLGQSTDETTRPTRQSPAPKPKRHKHPEENSTHTKPTHMSVHQVELGLDGQSAVASVSLDLAPVGYGSSATRRVACRFRFLSVPRFPLDTSLCFIQRSHVQPVCSTNHKRTNQHDVPPSLPQRHARRSALGTILHTRTI